MRGCVVDVRTELKWTKSDFFLKHKKFGHAKQNCYTVCSKAKLNSKHYQVETCLVVLTQLHVHVAMTSPWW